MFREALPKHPPDRNKSWVACSLLFCVVKTFQREAAWALGIPRKTPLWGYLVAHVPPRVGSRTANGAHQDGHFYQYPACRGMGGVQACHFLGSLQPPLWVRKSGLASGTQVISGTMLNLNGSLSCLLWAVVS